MNAIEINNLTKYYGKARGIIDVSLSVKKGEFFGFIGPNGAGKSTTIRTLLGLIHPTSGNALVLGWDISKKKELLNHVGYLASEAIFYSGMKVRDIISFSASMRKKDCSKEAELLCQRLRLDVNKKIDELSFGNRKKVAIVCALQHNPELLILDEPTSGLDPLMQKEFFQILKEKNEAGTTIFLSSHILSEIQKNCKRAAIIRDGKIISCSDVESLLKTNAKRVKISGCVDLANIDGVRDYQNIFDGASFLYSGDINNLINTLSRTNIYDLSITEPDLEEIFMHFYEKEDDINDDSKA